MKKNKTNEIILKLMEVVNDNVESLEKLTKYTESYMINMDGWIKDINSKMQFVDNYDEDIDENKMNITHNYELIMETKAELHDLKQEVNALKLIQVITLKKERDLIRERMKVRGRVK